MNSQPERIVVAQSGGGSGSSGGSDASQQQRLFHAVWRHRWLLLGLPLLGLAWAYAYLNGVPGVMAPAPKKYRAVSRIQVVPGEVDPTKDSTGGSQKARTFLKQQASMFKSDQILRPLSEDPEVQGLKEFRLNPGRSMIGLLMENISAQVDTNTDTLSVGYTCTNRLEAKTIVERAVAVYFEFHRQDQRAKSREQRSILEEEQKRIEREIDELTNQVLAIERQNPALIGGDAQTNPMQADLDVINDALSQQKQELIKAQAEAETAINARNAGAGTWIEYGRSWRSRKTIETLESRFQNYTQERGELEARIAAMLGSGIGPDAPAMKTAQATLDAFQKREDDIYLDYAKTYAAIAVRAYDELQRYQEKLLVEQNAAIERVNVVNEAATRRGDLLDARAAKVDGLNRYGERVRDLLVKEESGALNLTMMDPARPSQDPVEPNVPMVFAIYGGVGAGLAVLIVLLRALTDRRIWSVEEVPELLGTSVVGVFPRLREATDRASVGRIIAKNPESLAAEAIRSLRTATSFALPRNGRGVVLVTSSRSGEGKSICASNLALALAQAGRHTLLVDADLRKPGQNEIWGTDAKKGLGDVLRGKISRKGAVHVGLADKLDLMAAGGAGGRAAELLESDGMRSLLDELRREYDCVVLDSSPVLETAEARFLASQVDQTLFVLRLSRSTVPEAKRAMGILHGVQARVLGVMLNGSRTRRGAKSYAGGIAYGYGSYPGYGTRTPQAGESRAASVAATERGA
jgi:capsular exopolysaccharide synthesis family protein